MTNIHRRVLRLSAVAVFLTMSSVAMAQSVGLPAPRLLTTMPMGGKVGTQFEVTITGEHLDDADELVFSDPRITAVPKKSAQGATEPNKYVVTIAGDCPVGVYDARLMTRLGISSSRAFAVGKLDEVTAAANNTSLANAFAMPVGSVCNAKITPRAIDYFSFEASKGQRVIVDCASNGIDSKLNATIIIADAAGRDLLVERSGDALDFTVPETGKYVIKVHDLTYKGGADYYYRLGVWQQPVDTAIVRQPGTRGVSSFSWPAVGLDEQAALVEAEPNNDAAQQITLPCDITGSFFPAADVDVFEFEAKKGQQWWIEVASERLGRPTDPSLLVQKVTGDQVTDVLELSDIPSPVKVSSNGYAYDGPVYNSGTSDFLGKLTINEDGRYRIRMNDLFGGTRNDRQNIYRLVIREAAPDFALVSWALHRELRNGDRNALSKPIALRGGATMALEVVAFRRDGFDGEIELAMEGLPQGVTAHGVTIPAGQSYGVLLITAAQDAPRVFARASFVGRGVIEGKKVTRTCRLASMAWPITDHWRDVPSPRLLADVPVSVSGVDLAPITIVPKERRIEAVAGEKVKIPFVHTRRSEFSGATMKAKAVGAGFERASVDLPLDADSSEAELDLAAMKTAPGEYTVSFQGGAVVKYRHHPEAVPFAEVARDKAAEDVKTVQGELDKATKDLETASADAKTQLQQSVNELKARLKVANDVLTAKNAALKKATDAAKPRDIVDIVVTEPVTLVVKPAEKK